MLRVGQIEVLVERSTALSPAATSTFALRARCSENSKVLHNYWPHFKRHNPRSLLTFLGFAVHGVSADFVLLVFVEHEGETPVKLLVEFGQIKLGPLLAVCLLELRALHEFAVGFFGRKRLNKFLLGQSRVSVQIHTAYDGDGLGSGCEVAVLAEKGLQISFVDETVGPVIHRRECFCSVEVLLRVDALLEFLRNSVEGDLPARLVLATYFSKRRVSSASISGSSCSCLATS